MEKPWTTGPKELLQHGLEHLQKETDFDRRMALISIDNAVELMIKTYLGLPKRETGIKISRQHLEKISERFSTLLDALEKHSKDKIIGISLTDLEFYHRLRNKIYHEGSGITVERLKVEQYAEIAKILFENLFGIPSEMPAQIEQRTAHGEFIKKWADLEEALRESTASVPLKKQLYPEKLVNYLFSKNRISKEFAVYFATLLTFRNNLVHGEETPLTEDVVKNLLLIKWMLKELNESK